MNLVKFHSEQISLYRFTGGIIYGTLTVNNRGTGEINRALEEIISNLSREKGNEWGYKEFLGKIPPEWDWDFMSRDVKKPKKAKRK